MKITLVTGGARSGKTAYALEEAARLGGEPVTYVATARAGDAEMSRRIQRHRDERPASWETLEAPLHAGEAVMQARNPVVVLDCLTLLLSNHILMDEGSLKGEEDVEFRAMRAVDSLLAAARSRTGRLFLITNEVGMGIVPTDPLGRWFRDAQGRANKRVAAVAEDVVLMVSGIPLRVRRWS